MNIKNKIISENKWFDLARLESLKTNFRSRVGAVLVRKGRAVAVGRNKPHKTHPILRKYDPYKTLHAEIDACIGTNRDLIIGSDIYVYRELKDGTLAMARPCEMCRQVLEDLGIKRVFYTTEKGYEIFKIN